MYVLYITSLRTKVKVRATHQRNDKRDKRGWGNRKPLSKPAVRDEGVNRANHMWYIGTSRSRAMSRARACWLLMNTKVGHGFV